MAAEASGLQLYGARGVGAKDFFPACRSITGRNKECVGLSLGRDAVHLSPE